MIARKLADRGFQVEVIDERHHIAGNCFTERDPATGIMVHLYGPHIFHTSNRRVWDYLNRFAEFTPYIHRVKATAGGAVYSLPINLHTINQHFGKVFSPAEARRFFKENLENKGISAPVNLEEQALRYIGRELYELFIRGYTSKQWGDDPANLPASVLQRLPVRFNYDDTYFSDTYQGIPSGGYTDLVRKMLDSENIELRLNTSYEEVNPDDYVHIFYSGRIDRFYGFEYGELPYRTLDFEFFHPEGDEAGDFQGCAQMNFCDGDIPYTRITEHKHFSPFETFEKTVCTREFSRDCSKNDIPFYPVSHAAGWKILDQYLTASRNENKVTFVGRLGTHQYLDMDDAVAAALKAAETYLETA